MRAMLRRNGYKIREVRALIEAKLWAQILIALAAGFAFGLWMSPELAMGPQLSPDAVEALGDWLGLPGAIFLNMIQMVVTALILTSIVLGVASAGDPKLLARTASRIGPYFVATTTIAVLIGVACSAVIQPGRFLDPTDFAGPIEMPDIVAAPSLSVTEQIAALIPANPAEASLNQNMLQIVVAAIFIGAAVLAIGVDRCAPLLQFARLSQEVAMKIVSWAMRLAPIAVFGLIADFAMKAGLSAMAGLSAYMATVLLGLALLLGLYLLIVRFLAGRSITRFLSQIADAQLLAFSTSSSAATMPLSISIAETRLGAERSLARFIIPLGATINMDGTALYQVTAALFITQAFGIHLDPATFALLAVTVIGASIGSPSTPGVGIVILASILAGLGVPPAGVAILLGVDRILDMCRTALNVTGDLTATVVMQRWLGDMK